MKRMLIRLGFFLSLIVGSYFAAYRGSELVSSWIVQNFWENVMAGWTLEKFQANLWILSLSVYIVVYLWAVVSALLLSLVWNIAPMLEARKTHAQVQRGKPRTKEIWGIALGILLLFGTVYVLGMAPMSVVVFASVMLAGEYLYGGGSIMDRPRLAAVYAVPTV